MLLSVLPTFNTQLITERKTWRLSSALVASHSRQPLSQLTEAPDTLTQTSCTEGNQESFLLGLDEQGED